MNISTKANKLTRIIATTFGLISVPLLSSLVLLSPAHAEGDDIVCNQSRGVILVSLRAINEDGASNWWRNASVNPNTCKTIFWRGADGLEGKVTEWIQVADRQGPMSPDRYVDGVNKSETRGAWMLMRTGRIVVR